MRRYLLLIILFSTLAFSQNKQADAIIKEISNSKSDSTHLKLTLKILLYSSDLTQQDKINYSKKILHLAKKQDDKVLESIITAGMGYLFLNSGNKLQATQFCYKALDIANEAESDLALGLIYNVLALCNETKDVKKYRNNLFKSLRYCKKANDNIITCAIYKNLSETYFNAKERDSCMYYAQKSLLLSHKFKQYYVENNALLMLGSIHYYLFDNKVIGHEYFRKALKTRYGKNDPEANLYANLSNAYVFEKETKLDSAFYYTNKAYKNVNKIPYSATLYIYKMYKKLYLKTNTDSALVYYQKYETVKDSINKMSNIEQQQLLTFQKEIEIENLEEERKLKIQYSFMSLGILIFLTLFLLLSTSIIINSKQIKFIGIVSLLVVFEFINLILHPFLESITHHNPFYMLLILVGIAALLIPLHHRIEHWAISKLIDKNRQIRLAIAKKTIEKLENKEELEEENQT